MIVTKPADLRKNQKEYFAKAYAGETVVVSRPRNENVVCISEEEYNRLMQERRLMAYYIKLKGLEHSANDEEADSVLADISKTIYN